MSFEKLVNDVFLHTDILEIARLNNLHLKSYDEREILFNGTCPFHLSKNKKHSQDTFFIDRKARSYYCIDCNIAGNFLGLMSQFFPDSTINEHILNLAIYKHIPINISSKELDFWNIKLTSKMEEEIRNDKRNYQLLSDTKNFFKESLENEKSIKNYLINRGYTAKLIEECQIGYAPNSWSYLVDHLVKKYDLKELMSHGLIQKKDKAPENSDNPKDYYSRFKDRIIFPIILPYEENVVSGFAGRINPNSHTSTEKTAKFINSIDNTFYHKGQILYGLNRIQKKLLEEKKNEKAVIYCVEGYMDADISQLYGVNAVCVGGTSITDDQAFLMGRYANEIVLIGDGDTAGIRSTKSAFEKFLRLKIPVSTVLMKKGMDPDDYVLQHKDENIVDLLNKQKKDLPEFLIAVIDNMEQDSKTKIFNELIQTYQVVPNNVKRFKLMYDAAKKFDLDPFAMLHDFRQQLLSEIIHRESYTIWNSDKIHYYSDCFVASVLMAKPEYAKTFFPDVRIEEIPDDNSIFNSNTLQLYKYLQELYADSNPQLNFGFIKDLKHISPMLRNGSHKKKNNISVVGKESAIVNIFTTINGSSDMRIDKNDKKISVNNNSTQNTENVLSFFDSDYFIDDKRLEETSNEVSNSISKNMTKKEEYLLLLEKHKSIYSLLNNAVTAGYLKEYPYAVMNLIFLGFEDNLKKYARIIRYEINKKKTIVLMNNFADYVLSEKNNSKDISRYYIEELESLNRKS